MLSQIQMRKGFENEYTIANFIESFPLEDSQLMPDIVRAIRRDLWHIGMTKGHKFLSFYIKNIIFRRVFDFLRAINFFADTQLVTEMNSSEKLELFFVHHPKYYAKISKINTRSTVTLTKSKKNYFRGAIKTYKYYRLTDSFIFMSSIVRQMTDSFNCFEKFDGLCIFEGDAAITALATNWARQNNLSVTLYQWGHVPPGKSLIAFNDIGADRIICDNTIIAHKLKTINQASEIIKVDRVKNYKAKVLFIDQGINNFVDAIISKQMDTDQFLNADITLKEIQSIKKVLKQKLANMYHLRIEYPD